MGYKTVGRGRDSNKLQLHLESKNSDNVSFISNIAHHYSNESCFNSFNCHNSINSINSINSVNSVNSVNIVNTISNSTSIYIVNSNLKEMYLLGRAKHNPLIVLIILISPNSVNSFNSIIDLVLDGKL